MKITEPLFFERNRVGRVYTGGMLFNGLFGDEPVDNYEPEEWIASGVKAINKISKGPKEGVSKIAGTDVYFDELLAENADELLGHGKKFRILVKALDSAIRLPAQVHPDKAFSQQHFNSTYGKTECWLILDTRPDAKIFFGFKDGVTRADLEKAVDDSLTDPDAMERLMREINPKVGDFFLVPAKTVHAIGKGCLILEVQEPTDFTIQPEHFCGEYKLSEDEMFIGLERSVGLDCFNFGEPPKAQLFPKVLEQKEGYTKESMVGPANTDCFIVDKINLTGGEYTPALDDNYAIYIVVNGEGTISGENYSRSLKRGDYFFMPACLMGKFKISGNIEVVECY